MCPITNGATSTITLRYGNKGVGFFPTLLSFTII